jgi:predicted ferric reductase
MLLRAHCAILLLCMVQVPCWCTARQLHAALNAAHLADSSIVKPHPAAVVELTFLLLMSLLMCSVTQNLFNQMLWHYVHGLCMVMVVVVG